MVMRVFLTLFLTVASLAAADLQRLALESKAQADFERVQKPVTPQLRDTIACIQSQAALVPVVSKDLLSAIQYRKGYCTLASARITRHVSEYATAASDFERAIENWPARAAATGRSRPPEPLPSALRVLAAIAKLQSGVDEAAMDRAGNMIRSAMNVRQCSSLLMDPGFCDAVHSMGQQWLGWLDLRRNNVEAAVRDLGGAERSGWNAWALGRRAFENRNYRDAAVQYGRAVEIWEFAKRSEVTLLDGLGPIPDLKAALADLGGAQILAENYSSAIETLTRAAKEDPGRAYVLFLRGRARELASQQEAALADYNMASRSAFAAAQDLASGEAHLYRGIVLYHRKDFARAEDEFSSALNLEISPAFRGDAAAWRHLAAVSAGSCDTARAQLDNALASVSPYFPKDQARSQIATCLLRTSARPVANPSK
jgi:tetratricopeptide (TPR) repeat protein